MQHSGTVRDILLTTESLLRWLKEDSYETACFELRVMGE